MKPNKNKIIHLTPVEDIKPRDRFRIVKNRADERRIQPFARLNTGEMALLGLTNDRRQIIRRQEDKNLYSQCQDIQNKHIIWTLTAMLVIYANMALLTYFLISA